MLSLRNVPVSALLLCVTGLIWIAYRSLKPRPRYPPGPKGLPIVGSLLDINNARPWITYSDWARKYGDVVMFWAMGNPTILLGSIEDAHALLDKRMVMYGDRPEMVMAQDMVTQKGYYLGTARSKWDTHKKQRKILAERLRAKELRNWAHPASTPEVHLLLQRIGRNPDSFVSIIKCFTVNVMLNTTFAHGSISTLNDPLLERIKTAAGHQFMAQVQGRYWVDYFPPLKHLPSWLPGMGWKRLGLAWRQEVDDLYSELWQQNKARAKNAKDPQPCLVQNLLENEMHQLAEQEGTTLSAAMVDAGTETLTATTIVFLIIFMYYPEVLKKAQEQVDRYIGRERLPTFEDVPRMPYITAMIREAFRWHTVAPIAIPHSVIQDDEYKGYHIPKGATVIGLSHHIHYQNDLYPQPEEYRPERFLDESGKLNTLPHAGFGFGVRKCLGVHFAEQTLFLLITSFVWAFSIEAPIDSEGHKILPSLNPQDWGAFLASPPPMDFEAVITPRSARALELIDETVEQDGTGT